jgi:hypothetical protein
MSPLTSNMVEKNIFFIYIDRVEDFIILKI